MCGIHDPRVNALAGRIKVSVGEPGAAHHLGGNRLTSKYGEVSVTLRNGQTVNAHSLDMPDSMIKPNWNQMVARFHNLTCDILPSETREAIVEVVSNFEKQHDCSALIKLLVVPKID